ncbi:hypothetical protein ABT119_16325 [Streptomyces sp. NPDC001910]
MAITTHTAGTARSAGATSSADTARGTEPTRGTDAAPGARTESDARPAEPVRPETTARTALGRRVRDADGMAVAAFILGLVGLLVLNVFLGPIAVVLASVALWRGTTRRGRAFLGLGLGIADLVVLIAFMHVDSTVSWSF